MTLHGRLIAVTLLCISIANPSLAKGNRKFALYASALLDSTIHYYRTDRPGLFRETYPLKHDASVSYLVGEDKVYNDKVAYLWPTSGILSATTSLLKATKSKQYLKYLKSTVLPGLDAYYDTQRTPPCFQSYLTQDGPADRYYDDNVWIGQDFVRLYQLTHEESYLEKAKGIWTFLESGTDSALGGGIYWCEQKKTSKNTCSNAPATVLALQLFQATANKKYLDAAKSLYQWTKETLQDTSDYLYNDNINLRGHISKAKYAYNSGQMLHAAALLYMVTKERIYLDDARQLAEACSRQFFTNTASSFTCLKDGNVWFTAVMLRGFLAFHAIDKSTRYLDVFSNTLYYMWQNCRDEHGLFADNSFMSHNARHQGEKWLLTQAALIEMYASLAAF